MGWLNEPLPFMMIAALSIVSDCIRSNQQFYILSTLSTENPCLQADSCHFQLSFIGEELSSP